MVHLAPFPHCVDAPAPIYVLNSSAQRLHTPNAENTERRSKQTDGSLNTKCNYIQQDTQTCFSCPNDHDPATLIHELNRITLKICHTRTPTINYVVEVCMIREFLWVPWGSNGNGKHRRNS